MSAKTNIGDQSTIADGADANGVSLSMIQQTGDTLASSDGADQYTGLNSSVNRSLGSQIHWRIKDLPVGTAINPVTIGD